MGTTVGVGYSFHRNPEEAGREAAVNAMKQAGIEVPDFVFVFATVGYSQDILIGALREATSGAPLSGCSGEGIIAQDTVSESNFGVAVMAIKSDELRFNNACATEIGHRSDIAGEHLAAEIKPFLTPDTIACLIFADGLFFNFDTFKATFEKSICRERRLPILGGLSADNWSTQKTFQYHNDHVFSEGISCVIMSGKGEIAYGVNHGCVPVGTKRTITRSDGNIIYEIDGVPALEALKDYFEEGWQSQWNKISINLCLGFKTPEDIRQNYEEYIIRYMITKNDRDGSVTIPCDAPEGADLWMVRRDSELITSGLRELSRNIKEKIGTVKPKFVLHFECAGRGKVILRERVKIDLISSLQKELGGDIPWIGFYGYGEIGPVAGYNCFHNFTSVVTVVY
jgi:hypothetical protein